MVKKTVNKRPSVCAKKKTQPRNNQGMLIHRSKMAASSSVSLTEELFQVTRLNQYKDSIQAIHPGEGISEKMFSSSVHGAKFEIDNLTNIQGK